jgi:cytochrome c peroxidase
MVSTQSTSRLVLTLVLPTVAAGAAFAQGGPPPPPPPPPLTALQPPAVPLQNPITEAKRVLGKMLFWDEQLSSADTVACGTCHQPGAGGKDGRAGISSIHPGPDGIVGTADDRTGSHGVLRADVFGNYQPDAMFDFKMQATGRSSPSNLMSAYFPSLFWDGRASGEFVDPLTGAVIIPFGGALESLSLGPILSDVEMADEGRTWADVTTKLAGVKPLALAWDLPIDLATALVGDPSYSDLFQDAFGLSPSTTSAITPRRIAMALATYQRKLVPDQTPVDDFLNGNASALTFNEQQGLQIFGSPGARCSACHSGSRFSDGRFRNLGLRPIDEDLGRFAITGIPDDRGRFKTPSLRNVALKNVFFHNGNVPFTNLLDAIRFYGNGGGTFLDNRDPLLDGLSLTAFQIERIADFLGALTDPRVAAETFPFDRPMLNSERAPGLVENLGGAVAGMGGFVPTVITAAPAHVNGSEFRVGVKDMLGDARGLVAFSLGQPGQPIPPPGAQRFARLKTTGSGPGNGYATFKFGLPDDPSLAGLDLYVQFMVQDPSVVGNATQLNTGPFAKSDLIRMKIQ